MLTPVEAKPRRMSASSDMLREKLRNEEARKARKKKNEAFVISLFLPDLTLHEEVLATMTGEDAVREVIDKAREQSQWAAENDIQPNNYLLKGCFCFVWHIVCVCFVVFLLAHFSAPQLRVWTTLSTRCIWSCTE
jgi:hypothetical protein